MRLKIISFVFVLIFIISLIPFNSVNAAFPAWYNTDWSERRRITIDYTKLSGTVTNFPMLIKIDSDSEISAHAQSDGGDILFTNNSGTKLDHEILSYTTGTGALICYVEVDSISSTANTDIWMYYGHSDVADQWNINGTWNTNYKAVWHGAGSSTTISDSTASAFTLTKVSSTKPNELTGSSAKIYKAQDFNGSDANASKTTSTSGLDMSTVVTLETWLWYDTASGDTFPFLNRDPDNGRYYCFDMNGTSIYGGGSGPGFVGSAAINSGTWYHVMFVYDESQTSKELEIFVNGVTSGNGNPATPDLDITSGAVHMGSFLGSSNWFDGRLEEFRVSNINRGADWAKASYNSQNSPSTFYTIGPTVNYPAPATDVTATENSPTKVTVSWTKSADANNYHVYRDSTDLGLVGDVATYDDTGGNAPVITAGTASASDGTDLNYVTLGITGNSIANGTSYTYKVIAQNSGGTHAADSNTDAGYRLASTLNYQWQTTSTDADSGYFNIIGGISDNFSTVTTTAANDVNNAEYRGQSWTTSSAYTISKVSLYMCKAGTPSATATLTIKASDVNGKPTGSALSTGTINASSITDVYPNYGWYDIDVTDVALSSSTKYCLYLSAAAGGDVYNEYVIGRLASNGYANGDLLASSDSGGSWTVYSEDVYFKIYSTTGLTASYNDTSAPSNGDGRYYKCVLTATGSSDGTTSSNRGYRATPTYDVTNDPATKAFGIVAASSTYYAKGTAPSNPVADGDCTYTLTNTGNSAITVNIHGHNFTGGTGWTLGSSVGSNQVKITAYRSGINPASGVVLTTSDQELVHEIAASGHTHWDFKFETGTFTDGVEKTTTITLSSVAH